MPACLLAAAPWPQAGQLPTAKTNPLSFPSYLLLHLQQAFSSVKAEMRELLAKHHVTQMTMKPVKRQYAFENPAVQHGQQWVLKASAGCSAFNAQGVFQSGIWPAGAKAHSIAAQQGGVQGAAPVHASNPALLRPGCSCCVLFASSS